MVTDAHQAEIRDAHRALGRYVYEFSRLVWWMRMSYRQGVNPDHQSAVMVDLALGEATAQTIANALFGAIHHFGQLSDAEAEVVKALRRRVDQSIQTRNNVAHGDWFIGWGSVGAERPDDPSLLRIRPTRSTGPWDHRDVSPAELDAWSDDLVELRGLVQEAAGFTIGERKKLGMGRLSDYQVLRDGRVVREGPKADGSTVGTA
jgi:hypothetical protein